MPIKDEAGDSEKARPDDSDSEANEFTLPEIDCSVCRCVISHPTVGNLLFVTLASHDPIKHQVTELQGNEIEIEFIDTPKLTVNALFLPENSVARDAGFDLMFAFCGRVCATTVAEAMRKDSLLHSMQHLQ